MTNCSAIQDDLKAWLDGELPFGRMLAVRRHVAHCPSCRQDVAAMRELATNLRASEDSAAQRLDPALRARILAALPDGPPPRGAGVARFSRLAGGQRAMLAGASLVLLAVGVGYVFAWRVNEKRGYAPLLGSGANAPFASAPAAPLRKTIASGGAAVAGDYATSEQHSAKSPIAPAEHVAAQPHRPKASAPSSIFADGRSKLQHNNQIALAEPNTRLREAGSSAVSDTMASRAFGGKAIGDSPSGGARTEAHDTTGIKVTKGTDPEALYRAPYALPSGGRRSMTEAEAQRNLPGLSTSTTPLSNGTTFGVTAPTGNAAKPIAAEATLQLAVDSVTVEGQRVEQIAHAAGGSAKVQTDTVRLDYQRDAASTTEESSVTYIVQVPTAKYASTYGRLLKLGKSADFSANARRWEYSDAALGFNALQAKTAAQPAAARAPAPDRSTQTNAVAPGSGSAGAAGGAGGSGGFGGVGGGRGQAMSRAASAAGLSLGPRSTTAPAKNLPAPASRDADASRAAKDAAKHAPSSSVANAKRDTATALAKEARLAASPPPSAIRSGAEPGARQGAVGRSARVLKSGAADKTNELRERIASTPDQTVHGTVVSGRPANGVRTIVLVLRQVHPAPALAVPRPLGAAGQAGPPDPGKPK